jgi:predicted RNA-binding Zn-ribbon protein involved in translation (DUF1610 family)
VTGPTRFGTRVGEAAASFRCAACGEVAALVKAVPADVPTDMGPPLGPRPHQRDGIVVDYFGGTKWQAAEPSTYEAVRTILEAEEPDAAQLRQIDWEVAPFYCPECEQAYCLADWHTYVVFDEGFYDCTIGTCPAGHRHTVDD